MNLSVNEMHPNGDQLNDPLVLNAEVVAQAFCTYPRRT
jgi:hypothetical protein